MNTKTLIKNITILLSLTLVGFLTLSSFNNPDEDIIGTWILESDTDSKWVFTTNNCYWYYEGNLEDTFTYVLQDLSTIPNSGLSVALCGNIVKTGGEEDYYLKLTDEDDQDYCYEIFSLDNENLSINYLGQAEIKVFDKE